MTTIPPGFAGCSLELHNAALARSAFITFGVSITGGIAVDTVAQAVMDAIVLDATPSPVASLDSSVTLSSVTARVGQDGGDPLVFVATGVATGARVGATISPNVAVLVRKRSARGGRRGRGRMFWPWMIQAIEADEAGKITAATVTNLQLAFASMLPSMTARNVPMAILHSPSEVGIGHPTPIGAPDLVTSLQVDPLVATQRRRLGR